jgi:hypothetical protein
MRDFESTSDVEMYVVCGSDCETLGIQSKVEVAHVDDATRYIPFANGREGIG